MKSKIEIFVVAILLIGGWPMPARALSVAAEMFVSVPDQELVLIDRGKLISRYPISTSKFGLGDGNGTYRTQMIIAVNRRALVIYEHEMLVRRAAKERDKFVCLHPITITPTARVRHCAR